MAEPDPVPPHPPQPSWGGAAASVFQWYQHSAREEQLAGDLAGSQQELQALRALLDELPEIFERKYQERLKPLLERQQQLLDENQFLKNQVLSLSPSPGEVRLRFNAQQKLEQPSRLLLPAVPKQAPIPMARRRRRFSDADQPPTAESASPTRR